MLLQNLPGQSASTVQQEFTLHSTIPWWQHSDRFYVNARWGSISAPGIFFFTIPHPCLFLRPLTKQSVGDL